MNALVSGSHGHIGEQLIASLERKGYRVHRIDRSIELTRKQLKSVSGALIFHLAAYGNYYYQEDNREIIYANIGKLYNLLEQLNNVEYKAFVNFSTSSVILPHQTFYSATKASGEYIARAFAHTYNKPVISIRPFTVIGPREQEQHLIPTLIHKIKNNEQVDISLSPVHDYIDVRDLVRYVIRKSENIQKREYGLYFEVGSGKETTNEQVLRIVEKLLNKKAIVREVKSRPYDVTEGWSARQPISRTYTLEETIESMIYEK